MTAEQTAWMEAEWWAQAGPEDIWNGPGSGIPEHTGQLVDLLHLRDWNPTGQVLDLGCGDGRLLSRMAELFPERAFLGLDIVTRRASYPIPPNCHMIGGLDGRHLPLFPQSAAAAYSVLLFQHLPEDAVRGYLAEMVRVLVPGGRFVFQFVAWTDGCGHEDGPFNYRYAPTDVVDWCREAGFDSAPGGQALDENAWCWIAATKAFA